MSKRVFALIFAGLMFVSGLMVCCFPNVHGSYVDYTLRDEAKDFLKQVDAPKPSAPTSSSERSEDNSATPTVLEATPYSQLLEDMNTYNRTIYENGQISLASELAYEQPSFLLADYGLDSEIFGVISIPSLEIELPIYLGASSTHINSGVAHLSQTSLPIGGANTNSVIAGHRGWDGALFFRYITDLEYGDTVTVTNLWGTLHYTVVGTKIIEPNEVEQILIQPGRELLTLLTCHPYASGGKQRYLVICERTEHE